MIAVESGKIGPPYVRMLTHDSSARGMGAIVDHTQHA